MIIFLLYIIYITGVTIYSVHCGHSNNSFSFLSHSFVRIPSKRSINLHQRYSTNENFNVPSTLNQWKMDMVDTCGIWSIFYPFEIHKAEGLCNVPDVRPCPLFCDITGKVCGPDDKLRTEGAFLLDSGYIHTLNDLDNYVHSRRCVMLLSSGINHSTLRLVLAGRMFFSKDNQLKDLNGLLNLRSGIFLGQVFLEHSDNNSFKISISKIKHKVMWFDHQGNEINPENWKYQTLDGPKSVFRWMHGNDKWRLVGPFIGYRILGYPNDIINKNDFSIDESLYKVVDPLEINRNKFTSREDLEKDVTAIVNCAFTGKNNSEIMINNEEYLKYLINEMVELGDKGPDYYRGKMS